MKAFIKLIYTTLLLTGSFHETNTASRVPQAKFTQAEDNLLRQAVNELRPVAHWTVIADRVPGRTARQCRERYLNYLAPNVALGQFSQDEDLRLRSLYAQYGAKWSQFVNFFEGRTDIALKNRYNKLMNHDKALKNRYNKLMLANLLSIGSANTSCLTYDSQHEDIPPVDDTFSSEMNWAEPADWKDNFDFVLGPTFLGDNDFPFKDF
jgi:hypothetical protein